MKDQICIALHNSFKRLIKDDGYLFECPIEEHSPYYARKLHEVCLNHRLANYMEDAILPILEVSDQMFVDIEFNREGVDFKNLSINGEVKRVRPDIIIHNRKTGAAKINFLVVECKKNDSTQEDLQKDIDKIHAFMDNDNYQYSFGLQVVYSKDCIKGTLFFRSKTQIKSMEIYHKAAV